jgi:excisionase family DNA binding protein
MRRQRQALAVRTQRLSRACSPRCHASGSRQPDAAALLGWEVSEGGRQRPREAAARRALPDVHQFNLPEPVVVDVELNEPLLTAAEVAQLLAVPRSSVYEYARATRQPLPSIVVGRHRRFYRSDVEAWLAERRVMRP